ncbi:LOW QUALITY PROTEIN: hypothetical protein PHMEG_00022977 [Phytophthora megakarya]|uniref:Uncharacterized protein n=1 Tax=Phytophthora megakarya TaxID=4795 RepID=A0A225VHF7_9STRA|nr:LOW QUALITY PROTEIN: hypothetical protein PHMEG_00022977 [Phytophthora megakarya]
MDNTHVRLVTNVKSSYDTFRSICLKAASHDDPYFIQHYLRSSKCSDLTDFFLKLENAMKAAQEAANSVMIEGQKFIYPFHSMSRSLKEGIRIWMDRRKYIPYEDLKQSIEGNTLTQERYKLSKGTPETTMTKNKRILRRLLNGNVCYYWDRPRHNIRQYHMLKKDLRNGRVKAGSELPANLAFRFNSKWDHLYRRVETKVVATTAIQDRRKNRPLEAYDDGDIGDSRKPFRQEHRDSDLIAVTNSVNPLISRTVQAKVEPDSIWPLDSGCTRHVMHEGGINHIPIECIGSVGLEIMDSKGNMKTSLFKGYSTLHSCSSACHRSQRQCSRTIA